MVIELRDEMKPRERAAKYIGNLRHALRTIKSSSWNCIKHVVEEAERYVKDAGYYLDSNDVLTSIACSSYAEGLLDALRMLGLADFEWPRKKEPKVLVGGTFEILHSGHLYLLRKARELGRVVVVVARDSTVEKLKGRKPVISEQQRLEVIKSLKYVDDAFLGNEPLDVKAVLLKVKPDIVLLGPDQDRIREMVEEAIAETGLKVEIIQLRQRVGGRLFSSSEIIKRLLALDASQPQ